MSRIISQIYGKDSESGCGYMRTIWSCETNNEEYTATRCQVLQKAHENLTYTSTSKQSKALSHRCSSPKQSETEREREYLERIML